MSDEENKQTEIENEGSCEPDPKNPFESHAPEEKYPMIKHCYGKNVRQELSDIVNIIKNQKVYQLMGVKQPQSFKFVGEPGTGKTMGAEVITNQLNYDVFPQGVMLHEYATGTHGTAYINMGSRNLQQFFDKGREALKQYSQEIHSVIYYIDEADSIMGKRQNGGNGASKEDDKLLNTLMKNMQRINDEADKEYIILTTNHEKAIDEAAIRSGRIDKRIYFSLPDYRDRIDALEGFIEETNDCANYKIVRNYDSSNIAELTEGFNYADLRNLVNSTVQDKITKGLRYKQSNELPRWYVQEKDLIRSTYELIEQKGYSKESKIGF